ncbi:MAG: hypothetical protein ABEH58_08210 [Haloplanus sp.]
MSSTHVSSPSAVDTSDRKATLFCENCGHASPVDGDWTVRTVDERQRLCCPDCGNVVDERRVHEHTSGAPLRGDVDAVSDYRSA